MFCVWFLTAEEVFRTPTLFLLWLIQPVDMYAAVFMRTSPGKTLIKQVLPISTLACVHPALFPLSRTTYRPV